MPKKMGINSKAVEARERKAAVKKEKAELAEKQKEDEFWRDDDKNLAKKQAKKQEEEAKKAELLRKKAERKALEESELGSIQTTKLPTVKLTRAQIQDEVEKRNKNIEHINHPPKSVVPKVQPLEENLNRALSDVHVAQTIDQAIAVLSVNDEDEDKHPEKRMKAAYKAYESKELPRLKAENPSLKLSQLKQIIFKSWQKSPENPMNKV